MQELRNITQGLDTTKETSLPINNQPTTTLIVENVPSEVAYNIARSSIGSHLSSEDIKEEIIETLEGNSNSKNFVVSNFDEVMKLFLQLEIEKSKQQPTFEPGDLVLYEKHDLYERDDLPKQFH